ncbi:NAD-dependent epimerase/dehydratase family protein [Chloroflexota bacterium]
MKAIVVGGTGASGATVVNGLIARGFEVSIYHRGAHEVDEMAHVPHIHGNPFSLPDLERDLGKETYDLAVCMYGRLRCVAMALAGKTGKFVGLTGGPAYRGFGNPDYAVPGIGVLTDEEYPLTEDRSAEPRGSAIVYSEREVMQNHKKGNFKAVILRYPGVYGPRVARQRLWPLVRRVLDGRRHVILPGDGSLVRPRGFTDNVAHAVLLACDKEEANGQIYNVGDEQNLTIKEITTLIGQTLSHDWEIVEISHPLAYDLARGYATPSHSMIWDLFKIKHELGYQDVVPVPEAIRRTAQWLVTNRQQIGEQEEALVGNPYAYNIEDKLIASFMSWKKDVSASIPTPELSPTIGEYRDKI